MTYIEGFIVPAPIANKDAYLAHATRFAPVIREFGATRMVESWSDDVPEGKVTDFRKAVRPRMTKQWFSPGSSIPTGPRGMLRTRGS